MTVSNLTWFNLVEKLKTILPNYLQASKSASIVGLGATTNLSDIAAVYADLAAARTSVNTLKTEVETRLDNIETKVDELISKLTAAGIIEN